MINDVRNTVLSVLNKNNYGYISVSDFNLYAKQAQIDIFKQYMYDIRYNLAKENSRMASEGLANVTGQLEEELRKFVETNTLTQSSGNVYFLPSPTTTSDNLYKILNVSVYDTGAYQGDAEIIGEDEVHLLNSSMLLVPTKQFANYTIGGNAITVYPATITGASDISCTYIRMPKDPKWTYVSLANGEPIFDQSQGDYQDFELDLSEYNELVFRILQYAGFSIRELQIAQGADSMENQQENSER